jgi:5'-nucleotidase (lipoprotein e(P4) family)
MGAVVAVALMACNGQSASFVGSNNNDGIGEDVGQALSVDAGTVDPNMENAVQWVRDSAEYKAAFLQTYRFAAWALDEKLYVRDQNAGPWAVIMDGDETTLNNSEYQKERGALGFSPDSWNEWVNRRAATALPGVPGFTKHVHEMGGTVIIVTNRDSTQCQATQDNLTAVHVAFDKVLCKTDTSDKNPRFQSVTDGTADPSLPAFDVLFYFGDNILDFPDLSQASRTNPFSFNRFADDFVVLPNPMYGSWQANPKL